VTPHGARRLVTTVCFDLDDTLYPQSEWLRGAWAAVARRAALDGVEPRSLEAALAEIAAQGSDRGGIIDRALARVGAADVDVAPLVEAFRAHRPSALAPYPGTRDALVEIASRVPLGLISDGDPVIQRNKLGALGLDDLFSVCVWSDEHGRRHRKPDPLPFRIALERLGCDATDAVYVGDRPEKDVAGAVGAGMRAIRVQAGEWASQPDDDRAWASVTTVVAACAWLRPLLRSPMPARQGASTSTSTRSSNSPGASR